MKRRPTAKQRLAAAIANTPPITSFTNFVRPEPISVCSHDSANPDTTPERSLVKPKPAEPGPYKVCSSGRKINLNKKQVKPHGTLSIVKASTDNIDKKNTIAHHLDQKFGDKAKTSENGWMTRQLFEQWVNSLDKPKKPTLIIFDHYAAHKDYKEPAKPSKKEPKASVIKYPVKKLKEKGYDVAFVPPGCTGLIQFHDFAVNAPFKKAFTEAYLKKARENTDEDDTYGKMSREDAISTAQKVYKKLDWDSLTSQFYSTFWDKVVLEKDAILQELNLKPQEEKAQAIDVDQLVRDNDPGPGARAPTILLDDDDDLDLGAIGVEPEKEEGDEEALPEEDEEGSLGLLLADFLKCKVTDREPDFDDPELGALGEDVQKHFRVGGGGVEEEEDAEVEEDVEEGDDDEEQ